MTRISRLAIRMVPVAMALAIAAATPLQAAQPAPPRPSSTDRCPVCGMFVAKYPDFVCVAVLRNGARVYFDGAKDLFKYVFNPKKYDPRITAEDIAEIHVTDYYQMTLVDGRKAYYVIGSDVYGPMGKELIPFGGKPEAEEFLRDHQGRAIITFDAVSPALIRSLD
jgi:copper chaperone NosL